MACRSAWHNIKNIVDRKEISRMMFFHWKKEWSHFNPESWVTDWTKIRPGIQSNWRIFQSNWLSISSQFETHSQYRVNLTQIFSNYSESQVEFQFRQWLIFLGQNYFIFFIFVVSVDTHPTTKHRNKNSLVGRWLQRFDAMLLYLFCTRRKSSISITLPTFFFNWMEMSQKIGNLWKWFTK